jgi:hypothetical protein
VSQDRLAEIAALIAASRRRLSPERAYALITACEELLRAVPRQERLL